MHQNRSPSVLIIGAGLSGLALANSLARTGISTIICEKDTSPVSRTQGYRISIRSLGMTALKELLSQEKFSRLSSAQIADVGDGFTCANEQMEPLFQTPLGQGAAVQFLRSELRNLLAEGIPVQWNKRLTVLEEHTDQVIAHFADRTTLSADLVIGCDGAASTVRNLLPTMYNNRLGAIPHVIDHTHALLGGQIDRTPEWSALLPLNTTGIVRYLGPNNLSIGVCFSERSDRSPTVFWAISEKIEDRNALWYQIDQSQSLLEHCSQVMQHETWHPHLRKLVCETPASGILTPWLLRTTRFASSDQFPIVPSGRITLMGDAAHSMPPDRGMGGSHALEDARILSAQISNWPVGIAAYEKEMIARAKQAVYESEAAAELFSRARADQRFL